MGNVEPTLTASERPAEETRVVIEESGYSPETLEIPTVTLDDMQPEGDGHEDGNVPIHIRSGAARMANDSVSRG